MVYQEAFLRQFRRLGISGTLSLERYREMAGTGWNRWIELLPMGRAVGLMRELPPLEFYRQLD